MATNKTIKRFSIYWCNLDPTIGHEIQKTRPVVVVSPNELNRYLATVIVAPITSTIRPYPFRLAVNLNNVQGQIAVDQIRTIDKIRLVRFIQDLEPIQQESLIQILLEMFA